MTWFEQADGVVKAPPHEDKQPDWIHHVQDLLLAQAAPDKGPERAQEKQPVPPDKVVPIEVPDFKGEFFLVGGDPKSSLKELFEDKAKREKVVCIGLASDLPNSAELDAKALIAAGVPPENIIVIYERGGTPPTNLYKCSEDIPPDATAVYLGGGSQKRLRDRIDDKQLDSLKKLVADGATIAGNSAGTAVMSEEMITGGDSTNLTHAHGFGLVPWAIMDTHVGQRHREQRDITALYDIGDGKRPVFGMDPDTAVRFAWDNGKLVGTIIGIGTAHVFMPPDAVPPELNRKVAPQEVETDDGTHRKANMWDLRAGDTIVVPNVKLAVRK